MSWDSFEQFKAWLDKICRIERYIWASDWSFAVKFCAHGIVSRTAGREIDRLMDSRNS